MLNNSCLRSPSHRFAPPPVAADRVPNQKEADFILKRYVQQTVAPVMKKKAAAAAAANGAPKKGSNYANQNGNVEGEDVVRFPNGWPSACARELNEQD